MRQPSPLAAAGTIAAFAIFSLAACSQPVTSSSTPSPAAQVGAGPSGASDQPIANEGPPDPQKSKDLTDYLHAHQLPLVGGRVLASSASSPHQVILYGFVATPFGKADASDQARRFLSDTNAQVDNRIKVEPQLASESGNQSNRGAVNPDNIDPNNAGDAQAYQDQQALQQQAQTQQYQNQGGMSPGLMMMLPFIGMLGGFGGGGTSFGYGASPYGPGYGPSYGYGSGFGPGYGGPGYGGYGGYGGPSSGNPPPGCPPQFSCQSSPY